jgi:hypothetical protein
VVTRTTALANSFAAVFESERGRATTGLVAVSGAMPGKPPVGTWPGHSALASVRLFGGDDASGARSPGGPVCRERLH